MSKPKKLEIEARQGGEYMEQLYQAGPRCGESLLAFEMRMAALRAGRDLLLTRCSTTGDVVAALTQLGVRHNNHSSFIQKLGFLREELESAARSSARKPPVGLPMPVFPGVPREH